MRMMLSSTPAKKSLIHSATSGDAIQATRAWMTAWNFSRSGNNHELTVPLRGPPRAAASAEKPEWPQIKIAAM
jgi:hypothetical protein